MEIGPHPYPCITFIVDVDCGGAQTPRVWTLQFIYTPDPNYLR
jgi:hypothetical protein